MSKQHRFVPLLGAAVGGVAAAAVLPLALAHADDCTSVYCLVSGGDPTNVTYEGFRPVITDWQSDQPVNVDVPGSSFVGDVAGSYNVSEQDVSSPLFDNSMYTYSTFTPAPDNPGGIDSEGLAGATVYDYSVGPGSGELAGEPTYLLNNLVVNYADGTTTDMTTDPGVYTNFLDTTSTGSGDWIEFAGQSTPTLLWDTLNSSAFPAALFNPADVLPPDIWFPDLAAAIASG